MARPVMSPSDVPVAGRQQCQLRDPVTMILHDGLPEDYDGLAVVWTRSEVEVQWTTPWGDTRRGHCRPGTAALGEASSSAPCWASATGRGGGIDHRHLAGVGHDGLSVVEN